MGDMIRGVIKGGKEKGEKRGVLKKNVKVVQLLDITLRVKLI